MVYNLSALDALAKQLERIDGGNNEQRNAHAEAEPQKRLEADNYIDRKQKELYHGQSNRTGRNAATVKPTIDNQRHSQIIQRSHGIGDAHAGKTTKPPTQPYQKTENGIIGQFHTQIDNALTLCQRGVGHRQHYGSEEGVKRGTKRHGGHGHELPSIEQANGKGQAQGEQDKQRRNEQYTDVYLLIDAQVHAFGMIVRA